ncbi:MAG TPA: hypothetical protein VFY63_17535 [Pseudorhizobium sp.]|nr:hypothetical protein [Pseudorhizobium sp.]
MTQISTGTLEPGELAFLHRCFSDVCSHRGLHSDSDAANSLAAQLFDLYQNGVREERELYTFLGGRKLTD